MRPDVIIPVTTVIKYQSGVIMDALDPRGPRDPTYLLPPGWWKYCTGIFTNEHIYLIPSNANAVGKYNPKTDTFSTIDMSAYRDFLLPDGTVGREPAAWNMAMGYALQVEYANGWSQFDRNKYAAAVLFDGIIYC